MITENNVFAYLKGNCTDLEYLRYTHIGQDNPGSLIKINIFDQYHKDHHTRSKKKDHRVHYFYVIKRQGLEDSYFQKYNEYKIVDLNPNTGSVNCLYKEKIYDDNPSCAKFWEDNHTMHVISDKIDFYLDTTI